MTLRTGAAAPSAAVSDRSEDTLTLLITAWLIAGLFIDGYAHVNVIDTETEDFFTPWHAIFYSAFVSLAAWITNVGRRRAHPGPILDWFPAGYRPAVVGLGIFALGGLGDAIWHTVFGVEIGIDALLPADPPRLVHRLTAAAVDPRPRRQCRRDPNPDIAIGAVVLTTALLVFFIEYLFLVSETWFVAVEFDPYTNVGWEHVSPSLQQSPSRCSCSPALPDGRPPLATPIRCRDRVMDLRRIARDVRLRPRILGVQFS